MSKKKIHEEHEEENSERWLLTYSDMITLLLALFIILYGISSVNESKFKAIASQFRGQMGTDSTVGMPSDLPPGDFYGLGDAATEGSEQAAQAALDEVYETLSAYIAANNLSGSIQLTNTPDSVSVRITDAVMFVPDRAELLPVSRPIIEVVGMAIAKVQNNIESVVFSGHTADIGEHTLASDQISWRLSTERAITVLNEMLQYGLIQEKLSIQGYAHFVPVAANDTEENRAQNRRVEITIYKMHVDADANWSVQNSPDSMPDASSAAESAASGSESSAESAVSGSESSAESSQSH